MGWPRSTRRAAKLVTTFGENGIHPWPADDVAPGGLQERPDDAGRRSSRQGMGHRDRRAALDLEPEGAAGRSEASHVARRQLEDSRTRPASGASSPSTCERGLLFVPVEKVGNDYYGGPNHGNNLYSDSPARRRCEHRQDEVVPAARASRHLGLRSRRAADARRRASRRSRRAGRLRSSRRWA